MSAVYALGFRNPRITGRTLVSCIFSEGLANRHAKPKSVRLLQLENYLSSARLRDSKHHSLETT